jgi:protein-S-isoprenylcysteine O-methyltransferase Ste14
MRADLGSSPDVATTLSRALPKAGASVLILAAVLFLSSGQLEWAGAWAMVGLGLVITIVTPVVIARCSPGLIEERAGIRAGAKGWDKAFAAYIAVPGPLTVWLVAGFDRNFGWSAPLSPAWWVVGLPLAVAGYGITLWAMASNPFFSPVVRIQTERGHTVASGGPYRAVRHPGYMGAILFQVAAPLILGSAWALVPSALMIVVIVVRTALEDRTLRDELAGYGDYARRVHYRLLPGVW